jgi:hypothetical protein
MDSLINIFAEIGNFIYRIIATSFTRAIDYLIFFPFVAKILSD